LQHEPGRAPSTTASVFHTRKKSAKNARRPSALPVAETLLADRADHVFERRPQDRMPPDNKWGFRMPVPELLYNKGELYNLGVARGTLAEEERYKINEHIVQTLIMLSQLALPETPAQRARNRRRSPRKNGWHRLSTAVEARRDEPAGAHDGDCRHFRSADGSRPTLQTGQDPVRGNQDHVLHEEGSAHRSLICSTLFCASGVYREYAERFMKPEQIDRCGLDIEAYLSPLS
jgi:hypothetical protein